LLKILPTGRNKRLSILLCQCHNVILASSVDILIEVALCRHDSCINKRDMQSQMYGTSGRDSNGC